MSCHVCHFFVFFTQIKVVVKEIRGLKAIRELELSQPFIKSSKLINESAFPNMYVTLDLLQPPLAEPIVQLQTGLGSKDASNGNTYEWNEEVVLPITRSQLQATTELRAVVWDLFGPQEYVPIYHATVPLTENGGCLCVAGTRKLALTETDLSSLVLPRSDSGQCSVSPMMSTSVFDSDRCSLLESTVNAVSPESFDDGNDEWLAKLRKAKLEGAFNGDNSKQCKTPVLTLEFSLMGHNDNDNSSNSSNSNNSNRGDETYEYRDIWECTKDPALANNTTNTTTTRHNNDEEDSESVEENKEDENPATLMHRRLYLPDVLMYSTTVVVPDARQMQKLRAMKNMLYFEDMDPESKWLVQAFGPYLWCDPETLLYFLHTVDWNNAADCRYAKELMYTWAPLPLEAMLLLMSRTYLSRHVFDYAVERLCKEADEDFLVTYMPQLVWALSPAEACGSSLFWEYMMGKVCTSLSWGGSSRCTLNS